MCSLSLFLTSNFNVGAQEIGSVNTEWKLGGSHKIVVEALKDEKVQGVTCHISYAKTGGFLSSFAQDPSRFSIACRQTAAIVATNIEPDEEVSSFRRSILFKEMLVRRFYDKPNNTFVYLIYSTKVLNGSSFNSISSVPLMAWNGAQALVTVKK